MHSLLSSTVINATGYDTKGRSKVGTLRCRRTLIVTPLHGFVGYSHIRQHSAAADGKNATALGKRHWQSETESMLLHIIRIQ